MLRIPHQMEPISPTACSTGKKKSIRCYPVRIIRPASSSKLSDMSNWDVKRTGGKKSQPVKIAELLGQLQSAKRTQDHSEQKRKRAEPERLKATHLGSATRDLMLTYSRPVRRILKFDEDDKRDERSKSTQASHPSDECIRNNQRQDTERRYSRIPRRMPNTNISENREVTQRTNVVEKESKELAQSECRSRISCARRNAVVTSRSSQKSNTTGISGSSSTLRKKTTRKAKQGTTVDCPAIRLRNPRSDSGLDASEQLLQSALFSLRNISNANKHYSRGTAIIDAAGRDIFEEASGRKVKFDGLSADRMAVFSQLQIDLQRVLGTMEENVANLKEILARIADTLHPSQRAIECGAVQSEVGESQHPLNPNRLDQYDGGKLHREVQIDSGAKANQDIDIDLAIPPSANHSRATGDTPLYSLRENVRESDKENVHQSISVTHRKTLHRSCRSTSDLYTYC